MEILNKIYNKADFGLIVALLISVAFIPAVNVMGDSMSYLSFSSYWLIICTLIIAVGYSKAVEPTELTYKVGKISIGLIWVIFSFELLKSLSNFNKFFESYNVLDMLELGAFSSIILLIIVTKRTLSKKEVAVQTVKNDEQE